MGKISDALEKQNKEREIRAESLKSGSSKPVIIEDPELLRVREAAGRRKYSPKLIVLSSPESVEAENFKVLRAQIQLIKENGITPRTLLVTSTFPGEGKTFISTNLAASIALGVDEHVLLIDCDLRRPQVHNYFGYSMVEGLSEYLTGKRTIPELLIKTDIPKLSILSAGAKPPNPAELLSSRKMEAFIEEAKARYDDRYIILDATPTQFTSECSVLSRHVDGSLLVVMSGRSPRQAVRNGIKNLDKKPILGVVFNGYSEPMKSYRKYYSGYYHKGT
ncbi:MAG: polysaccharide biosynthesis tyrosine autokinase [Thermodesulfobacteriota bacterium]